MSRKKLVYESEVSEVLEKASALIEEPGYIPYVNQEPKSKSEAKRINVQKGYEMHSKFDKFKGRKN